MPYTFKLTWVRHANRWRKRYLGRTYYLKSETNGKKDRQGYLEAYREWERLKAYIDGLGANPYTETGAIIPENQIANPNPFYFPPMQHGNENGQTGNGNGQGNGNGKPTLEPARLPTDPAWILSRGFGPMLHPEQVVTKGNGNPYTDERGLNPLADFWLNQRKKQADRGELSLKQWSEDQSNINVFRKFMLANFPTVALIDQLDASILNIYRDKQWEFVGQGISKVTLRKRLATVVRFIKYLIDQNILRESPKDLTRFAKVKLDKPRPQFFSPDEIKTLAEKAPERTRLYIMLALNCGYTQKDIATLEDDMVNWDTGIIDRDRHKTGVGSRAKLWPATLELLRKHRNQKGGLVLVNEDGNPLHGETVNAKGMLISQDAIRFAFDRLLKRAGIKGKSFKHLRKTASNEIERVAPHLTSLFLAHGEKGTKRFYVNQHYQELFQHTDRLESYFGF